MTEDTRVEPDSDTMTTFDNKCIFPFIFSIEKEYIFISYKFLQILDNKSFMIRMKVDLD